ncbi:MAG: hypothetical protein C5B47_03320 [Verrucomicrobia bacterium]|nr:MAG: hypothetical protein C5B47_03320 [Verrucomicrobiota bacterium]
MDLLGNMLGTIAAVGAGMRYLANARMRYLANAIHPNSQQEVTFSSDFESGSIGVVRRLKSPELAYELSLRDDNNNPLLPASWRTWWYVRLDGVPTDHPVRLEFTRLGFPNYFVPVYSYDNKNWMRFLEDEVRMSERRNQQTLPTCRLAITKQFTEPTVWIARTFPYTTQDLSKFINSIKTSRFVKVSVIGETSSQKLPIRKITISDDASSSADGGYQKTIFINARTHPAETGSSFLLEGLINTILSDTDLGRTLRKNFVFVISPMQHVDGVVLGNYRTNANGVNLEAAWRFNRQSAVPVPLENHVPHENKVVGDEMWRLQLNQNQPVILALNLHSSNSSVNDPAFFYPHFGAGDQYTERERNLWATQTNFMRQVDLNYEGPIQAPQEGGRSFLTSYFPETWWWHNQKDRVNAITLETVYGKAGLGYWITPEDYRKLGKAVAAAIGGGNSGPAAHSRSKRSSMLAWITCKGVFNGPGREAVLA